VLALGRIAVHRERNAIVVDLVVGEVDGSFSDVLFGDGLDEETRASDVVLVILVEAVLVLTEDDMLWPGGGSIIGTNRNKKEGPCTVQVPED
jgi:hypothetical protein